MMLGICRYKCGKVAAPRRKVLREDVTVLNLKAVVHTTGLRKGSRGMIPLLRPTGAVWALGLVISPP
jgi:hypothetical protein